MAYTFSVNNIPLTGSVAVYQLVSTLVSAGWLKKMDSDGTTYSSTGVQVTSGASGTNGLGNSNAWVRLQSPPTNGGTIVNQTREITFQRGTTDLVWRVKYSASALFTGGTPGISQTPSSTDEVFMAGGGTDASPTFYALFNTNQTYHWNVACGGFADGYSFIGWSVAAGTLNGAATNIFLDVLASGTYPATDVDPAVMHCDNSGTIFNTVFAAAFPSTNLTNPALARAWLGATSAAGASLVTNSVNVGMVSFNQFGKSASISTNQWTKKNNFYPAMWGSNFSSPKGIKGFSTLFKFAAVNRVGLTTYGVASANAKDIISTGQIWVPWNGTDPAT